MLQAASRNPRRHLGSFLYLPEVSTIDHYSGPPKKLNVSIRPNLLPAFQDPENVNSTYTVRVSRTWLRNSEREAVCSERFLWGSGIFTDDSDPVAAAIHSGFVKGAWGDFVDGTLLEHIVLEQNPVIDAGQENVPDAPLDPPTGMDLHITLLVLPRLQRYEGSARYGLKSRTWPEEAADAPHDGVSFMVLTCKWFDEGTERGKGRTGLARRQRLHDELGGGIMKTGREQVTLPESGQPRSHGRELRTV